MQGTHRNQFETASDATSAPGSARGLRRFGRRLVEVTPGQSPGLGRRRGFTLTELLIVIAIIAVLAGLITAAAIRALNASKRARIVLEIKQVSGALENFKNDFGAYPPNAMNDGSNALMKQAADDMVRMLKKVSSRINPQELAVAQALAGANMSGSNITSSQLVGGMSASEAVVFWLGGFSDDPQFPLSGPGGPSFDASNSSNGEILEDRKRRYEFDLSLFGPRDDNGRFDASSQRFVTYNIDLNGNGNTSDAGETRQINLWRFNPGGSTQPLVYFDVSRYKPAQFDPPAAPNVPVGEDIFAFKKYREGITNSALIADLAFVNAGTYQVMHSGLDDVWGELGPSASGGSVAPGDLLLFPSGPYIGDTADNLTNFTDGDLADSADE